MQIFTEKPKETELIKLMKEVDIINSKSELLFGKIKPIALFLPDTSDWIEKWKGGKCHFEQNGINAFYVAGVHAVKWGISSSHRYLRDTYHRLRENFGGYLPKKMPVLEHLGVDELKVPYYSGDGKVGGILSHYILYNVMAAMNHEYYMILECDARFLNGWKEQLEEALKDIPSDFDFLFVGSCCAVDKEPIHVKGNLYHYPYREGKEDYYPNAGHCYIVSRKAISTIIATQRNTADPVDIQLLYEAFPYLNVYAILPRLADQENTELIP